MNNKIENRIWALFNQAKILSDDLNENISLTVSRDNENNFSFGYLTIGLYSFETYDSGKQVISYYPQEFEPYISDVDPDLIFNLDEPPKEKSPAADQDKQGTSTENNAQSDDTTKQEEGQDE